MCVCVCGGLDDFFKVIFGDISGAVSQIEKMQFCRTDTTQTLQADKGTKISASTNLHGSLAIS